MGSSSSPGCTGLPFLSPNSLRLLGYGKEEFLRLFGNDFSATIYEHDRDMALRTMEQQLESGLHIDVEYRIRSKSGALIWICHKGSPVSVDHGAPYIQSIIFDITHNREAAQAKRISDERYHFILEQHDIIIFEQNLETGHFSCSAQWLQTFGRVFNILEPDPRHTLIPVHKNDRTRLAVFQNAVRQEAHHVKTSLELRLHDAAGHLRWYRIEASNLTNAQESPFNILASLQILTSKRPWSCSSAPRPIGTAPRACAIKWPRNRPPRGCWICSTDMQKSPTMPKATPCL